MARPQRQIDDRADILDDPGAHWPHRPDWTCDADGQDWPCEQLRAHKLATMDRQDIALDMSGHFAQAWPELGHRYEVRQLHARFFAWARHEGVRRPPGGPW